MQMERERKNILETVGESDETEGGGGNLKKGRCGVGGGGGVLLVGLLFLILAFAFIAR